MKVVTFGEIMLRLTPEGNNRFSQANNFNVSFGGGEANVSVSLSNYGIETSFVTRLPLNPIADKAIFELKGFGVDTKNIVRGGDRIGIYYLEKGASQRPSKVIYDRKHSAISASKSSDYNWDDIFKGADWFHFTGITPALNKSLSKICLEACKKAKEMGIKISCDLNYRNKLWSTEEANKTMTILAPYIDVLIANEEDAEKVFNIKAPKTNVNSGRLNKTGYEEVANILINEYGFEKVAITLRESLSANYNRWSAMLYCDNEPYFSKVYDLNIIDRVGGGDSFCGGLIYSLLNNMSPQNAIDFAVAASCLKHSVIGDYNRVNIEEIENLLSGDETGRVQR